MSRIALACLVFTAACINNGPTPGGDDTGVIDATPRAGAWYYAETTKVSNTCGYQIDASAGDFLIDSVTTTSFRVAPNDSTAPFTCGFSGNGDFLCPDRASATADLHPAYDAILTVHATASGTFSSDIRASGRQAATVDCAGAQCNQLGAWPCKLTVDYVVAAR